jgi:hypothetical protein
VSPALTTACSRRRVISIYPAEEKNEEEIVLPEHDERDKYYSLIEN